MTFVGQHITPYHSITSICFVTSLTFITLLTSINIIQQFSPPPHTPRAASTQPKSNRLSHTDPHTGLQRRSTDSSDAATVAVAVAGQPRRWTNLEGRQAGALRCPTKARCNTTELGHCTHPDRHLSHQRASERLESVYYLLNSLRSLDSSPVIVPLPHRLFINMRTCEHTRLCQTAEAYASPLGPLVGTQRGSAASSDAAAAAAGQPNSWANLAGRLMGEARCHLKYRCNATELGCCAHTYHHLSHQHATERSDPMYCLSNALCSLDSSPEPVLPPYGLFIHSFTCEHAFLVNKRGLPPAR